MSLSARIMSLPHHASSSTEHWLDYAEGHRDARHAAAELAAEADAIRDELVAALTEARRIVKDARDAFGPCDHAVGICNCDMDRSIEASDAALASAKGQA